MSSARLSPNALHVLERRYLRRSDRESEWETPDELFRRVAKAISYAELLHGDSSQAEKWEAEFYQLLSSLDFLPNSPTLANAGRPRGQLSACFVLPVEDTLEDIFEAVKLMALVQRTGGGTGFSFSRLRPKGGRRPLHCRRSLGARILHESLRLRHREHQARGNATGGQHGGAERSPPRYLGVHRCQTA